MKNVKVNLICYKEHEIELASKLILTYKLYLCEYSGIQNAIKIYREKISNIVLATTGNIYIGSGIITTENIMHGCNIGIYVKPKYRKLKVGKKIYDKLIKPKVLYTCGLPQSQKFYHSVNRGYDIELLVY